MKYFSTLTVLISLFCFAFCSSCNKKTDKNEGDGFDVEFDVLDNENNSIDVSIKLYYRVPVTEYEKILTEYGKKYKELVLIPTLKSSTRNVLMKYSAAEIYNYKRPLIEDEIVAQTKMDFKKYGVELTTLLMYSVNLPHDLKKILEEEHLKRMSEQNQ